VIAVAPPLAFFDWTFLAAVEVPTLLVVGDRDEYCPAARLDAATGGARRVTRLRGVDHFFVGADDALRHAVEQAATS
jgi:alpha/beta superfamily hydrolase